MNYEEMSDFEINVRVAESMGLNWYCAAGDSPTGGWEYCSIEELMTNDDSKLKDYCNNPSDAWPIILKNKIDIQHRDGFKTPCSKHCEHMAAHDNPLRAAMIVFLMINEAGK